MTIHDNYKKCLIEHFEKKLLGFVYFASTYKKKGLFCFRGT